MKTFKTIAIIAVISAINLGAQAASAENTNKAATKLNAASLEYLGFGKTTEQALIEDYLAGQTDKIVVTRMIVYSSADQIVFEGDVRTPEAKEIARKADFLMEYDNALYYWIEQ